MISCDSSPKVKIHFMIVIQIIIRTNFVVICPPASLKGG